MLPHRPAAIFATAAIAALLASPLEKCEAQQSDSSATSVVISGTVYDSLSGRPLEGALVQMAASDLHGRVSSARTDSAGGFFISGVQAGEYLVAFTHPFLDSLGLDVPPMKLRVDGTSTLTIPLAIPAPLSIHNELCPSTQPSDSSGLLLGFLRDADTGVHLGSGRVVLEWTEVRVGKDGKSIVPERRSVSSEATSAGWYALCGVPTAGPIAAHARIGSDSTGYIDVRVPPRGVLHRDFNIPRDTAAVAVVPTGIADASNRDVGRKDIVPARRGRARLAGLVHDRSGRPLHGAQLRILGSDATASTDDAGHFTLAGLPAGTQTLEARQIGFAPKRVPVDLSSDHTTSVFVTLDKIADVLSEVRVYGEPSALNKKLEGFRQRMRAGWGRFITRADIQKRGPIRFTDMLIGMPGITVQPVGAFGYQLVPTIRSTHCTTTIVVDGHRLPRFLAGDFDDLNSYIWLDEVVGIEVYGHGTGAPAEYGGWGFCPVVLVWTSPDADVLDRAEKGSE
jgi:hypothetical protein